MDPLSSVNGNNATNIAAHEISVSIYMDNVLTIHISLQVIAHVFIFPTGIILGMTRSKWHVPVQATGILMSSLSAVLAGIYKGKQRVGTIHGITGLLLLAMLWLQVITGVYLKLSLIAGFRYLLRRIILTIHRLIGQLMMILSAMQIVNGIFTASNFCGPTWFSNCVTHSAFGLAFLAHGTLWLIVMQKGQSWIRKTGRSIDFIDSCHLLSWGIINTFTEHSWGRKWDSRDLEHTSMGIIWWCAGMVFFWQTCRKSTPPRRSPLGGVIFVLTGWIFSQHPQPFPMATGYHALLGQIMMALGVVRIIEIALIHRDKEPRVTDGQLNSFQYLTVYLCLATGFMFLGATEQMLWTVSNAGIGHVTWMICLNCLAFLYYLLVSILIELYGSGSQKDKMFNPGYREVINEWEEGFEREELLLSTLKAS